MAMATKDSKPANGFIFVIIVLFHIFLWTSQELISGYFTIIRFYFSLWPSCWTTFSYIFFWGGHTLFFTFILVQQEMYLSLIIYTIKWQTSSFRNSNSFFIRLSKIKMLYNNNSQIISSRELHCESIYEYPSWIEV
jgi:hypothetical protein